MNNTRRVFLLYSGLGATALALTPRAHAATPLAVVVGLGTSVDSISRAELKRLFLGETDNISGTVLVPFNMAGTAPERAVFLKAILAMSADQETKYWIDRRIRGQSGAPKSAPNTDTLLKVAAKFPKAITYVPAGAVKPDVKVLRIDGKLPSDPGYPLVG
jgi:hypothetical protein